MSLADGLHNAKDLFDKLRCDADLLNEEVTSGHSFTSCGNF